MLTSSFHLHIKGSDLWEGVLTCQCIYFIQALSKDEDDLQNCLLSFYLAARVDESRHTIVKETVNLLSQTHLNVVLPQVGDDLRLVLIEDLEQNGPSLAVLLQQEQTAVPVLRGRGGTAVL